MGESIADPFLGYQLQKQASAEQGHPHPAGITLWIDYLGRTPLTNVMGLSVDTPTFVVVIGSASGHIANGKKKNMEYMS